MRHPTNLWPLAIVCLGALGSAFAQPVITPAPIGLQQLETWTRETAPQIRLTQAELLAAQHRSDATQSRQGAQLFGNAGMAQTLEPVTDTMSRDYRQTQAQVGIRWPLLGSRNALQREAQAADLDVAMRRSQHAQSEAQAVQATRVAYVQHLRLGQRLAIASAMLEARHDSEQQLLRRRQAGSLLEADRLALNSHFLAAQMEHDSSQALQQLARQTLARLSGQASLGPVSTQPPQWPLACLRGDTPHLPTEPAGVQQAQLEVQAAQQRAQHAPLEGIEAHVSIAHSLSRDIGGQPGHSTRLGVDFSIPLQWRAQRNAALGQAQAEVDRTQALLTLRRSEYEAALQRARANFLIRDQASAAHAQHLQAHQEALRIALLRLDAFDGDGYSKLLTARHALYQAALRSVEDAERRDLAALDWLALQPECDPAERSADAAPAPLASTLAALGSLAASGVPAAQRPSAPPAAAGLSWYSWRGQQWLQNPSALQQLPAHSTRVMLSFTAHELQQLTLPQGRARLERLVQQAHARQLRVELLLGEPTWVLPAHRQALTALLQTVRGLPFDGLHLDLERSQLPPDQQAHWSEQLMQTLRAVRDQSPWPIGLTTHYREWQAPDFARQAREAGASELVAMVYVNQPRRVAELMAPVLGAQGAPPTSVALSIEKELSPEESSFRQGRAASLRRWQQVSDMLRTAPGFRGVVVQSLEEFWEARP